MMRFAVLCNHPMGMPSIDLLLQSNLLCGIACPSVPSDNFFRLQVLAQEKNIPFGIIDPNNTSKTLTDWIKQVKPDAVMVYTFPFKIPKDCLKLPKHGFLNFHTGRLPAYRGGDPILWEMFAQEPSGGVTVHLMDEHFDRGPICFFEKVDIVYTDAENIQRKDTYGQHIQKLAVAARNGTDYIIQNIQQLKFTKQDESKASYQNKPSFFNLIIDWDKFTAAHIDSLVRASNPVYGGAITFFRGVPVHLLQVAVGSSQNPPDVAPGTIVSASKDGLIVLSSDKKLIRLDVVYTEDGFFTGGKLATTFSIKPDEQFILPEAPAQTNT